MNSNAFYPEITNTGLKPLQTKQSCRRSPIPHQRPHMATEAADTLVQELHKHNPWWEDGTEAFSLPARQKSDFYHLVRPDDTGSQIEDQPLIGLVGRRGVGKTTLIHEFIHHRIQQGDPPERFLYLPFNANPLYQLDSDKQLRRAVRHYEARILGRLDTEDPHFLLLDDVNLIEHPTKPTIDGWGVPIADCLDTEAARHIVVTASAGIQVRRELAEANVPESSYDIQPILPEKFRDYIFSLYPELEASEATRISPTSLREGQNSLPHTLETGNVEPFLAELQAKHDQISDSERRIQSQVTDYLAMGGTISYAQDGAIQSVQDLDKQEYERLRENVRDALYQEVPGFESIQTIADLDRLIALAARHRAATPHQYQALVELFDVDRRTIADSYLPALEQLYLLSGVTEYDNSRPRSVRLYLRDPGLVVALADRNPHEIRSDFELEADLASITGFDHTMRFVYGVNVIQDYDRWPSVQFWQGRAGEVDYVFEVGETPVPVGLAYRPSEKPEKQSSIQEFLDSYEVPVGILLAGNTLPAGDQIKLIDDRLVQVPYWFYLLLS